MGKVDDFTAGRMEGLVMAKKLVEEGGIDALEREIKFRNMTGIHTAATRKELEKATNKIKMNTIDTVLILSTATLHDEFGFGSKRCQQFIKRFNLKAECLMDDMATWSDYINIIRKELGINMVIRRNEQLI